MTNSLFVFALAVGFSYIYAFVGGFTDAANAIATSVGTKVLRPRTAVVMAGIFNLLGGLTGTAVAVTIASGIVDPPLPLHHRSGRPPSRIRGGSFGWSDEIGYG